MFTCRTHSSKDRLCLVLNAADVLHRQPKPLIDRAEQLPVDQEEDFPFKLGACEAEYRLDYTKSGYMLDDVLDATLQAKPFELTRH